MGARFEKVKTVIGLGTVATEAAIAIALHRSNVATFREKRKVDAVVRELDLSAALSYGGPVMVKDPETHKNIKEVKVGPDKEAASFTLKVASREAKDLGADTGPIERVIFDASSPDAKPEDAYDKTHTASVPFEERSQKMGGKIWERRRYELILVGGIAYTWMNMRDRIKQNRGKQGRSNQRSNKLATISLASV